jgi:hypothetical protein
MSNADQFRQYAEEAMGWARLAETQFAGGIRSRGTFESKRRNR